MPDDPDAAALAEALRAGVAALRGGRPAEAVDLLAQVVTGLEGAGDLADVHLRASTLLAQALLETGSLGDASRRIQQVRRAARAAGDRAAAAAAEELDLRVRARATEEASAAERARRLAAVAERPLEDILARASGDLARAAALIEKANAELGAGRPERAGDVAREALLHARAAHATREQVLAHLTIAEAEPARARSELLDALDLADRAHNTGLITLIARAAEAAGVELPSQHGPDLGHR